jgi:hypothetical protein
MARNLWDLGNEYANNPSMLTRIMHSSKGTAVRRSVKGSTIPKIFASAGAYALKNVPIPILNDLLNAAVNKAYEVGKNYYRNKYQKPKDAKTAEDRINTVKFGWKDMDVQDMDRYRWKVASSLEDLNKATDNFKKNYANILTEGNFCDEFIKVTTDFAYAHKRVEKLRKKATEIQVLTSLTLEWLNEVEGNLNTWAKDNKNALIGMASKVPSEGHVNCDPTVCANSSQVGFSLQHKQIANATQIAGNFLSSAFDPMEFINISKPDDHQIKVDNPYTGKKYD